MKNQQEIRFVRRPEGLPSQDCFRLVEAPMPKPLDGQVLVQTHYLSIDPYMRRAMGNARNDGRLTPGDTMIGRGAGIVVESQVDKLSPGDAVQGEFGWREYVVLDAVGLRKLPSDMQPLSLSLGIVGQSAATAWVGLHDIAGVKSGETVVVSAAAGAVGSAVGQIARMYGCRVVGIAGGREKCSHVVDQLGFHDCVDYKAADFLDRLAAALPGGVDVYFDNVGGTILEAVLDLANDNARFPICGQISQYNAKEPAGLRNVRVILDKSVTMRGFRIGANLARRDYALDQLMTWWRKGQLKHHETVVEGLSAAPSALINILEGGNIGKQVVKLR